MINLMTTVNIQSELYEKELQIFIKSPFLKKIITMVVKNGDTWGELVNNYVKILIENDVKYSLENFKEDFYGEFRVTSFNRRFKFDVYKEWKLCDMGLEKDKQIEFKKLLKEIPDEIGKDVITKVFNHLIDNFNSSNQQIIVSNNSFNVTEVVEKNIRQQWQPRYISSMKDELIIILWDKAFFHPRAENRRQIYDYVKLKELTVPNDKIRIFCKEKKEPIEMTPDVTENKAKYFEILKQLISEKNLTDKQITWYVINFNDTTLLPFNSIIEKIFSDKKTDSNMITYCYFCGERYHIN